LSATKEVPVFQVHPVMLGLPYHAAARALALAAVVSPSQIRGWGVRTWRNLRYEWRASVLSNPHGRRLLAAHPPVLTTVQQRAVRDLRERGVAFVSYKELGVDDALWQRLRLLVQDFVASSRVRDAVTRYRREYGQRPMSGDDYMIKLYPEGPSLASDNPLLLLGLSGPILDVVNQYMGMWTRLIYTDVWHTIPLDATQRIGSQEWHRDPEDSTLVKVYAYFAEVDATAGPLEYIQGTAVGGAYQDVWKWAPRGKRYPPPGEIDRLLADAPRVSCVGAPGTFVFCDTGGFHRGGLSTEKPRIAATWTFVRPGAVTVTADRRFQLESGRSSVPVDTPAARFALA
jgi:hypothetical protein